MAFIHVQVADSVGFICLNNRGRRKALRRGLLDEILQALNDFKNGRIAAGPSPQKKGDTSGEETVRCIGGSGDLRLFLCRDGGYPGEDD
jgi:hypothetical protein